MTTEAGRYMISKAVWDAGMRGHFIRMFSTTGPQDIEIMVRKIEEEAEAKERVRIKADVEAEYADAASAFGGEADEVMLLSCAAIIRIVERQEE